ncbi:MAG: trehalase family glycosidase, partial [Candidatus Kryptoniota bacterium]
MFMVRTVSSNKFIALIFLFATVVYGRQTNNREVLIKALVRPNLDSLLAKEDTDGDKKITIDDFHITGTDRGNKRFWLVALDGRRYEVDGTYYLSNLLQSLKLAEDEGKDTVILTMSDIFESPVKHILKSIKNLYWHDLTRRIDEGGLEKIFKDEKVKTADGYNYVYVPFNDTMAYGYFSRISKRRPELRMMVVKLPQKITPQYVNSLDNKEGVLSLKLIRESNGQVTGEPFVVPGGRFNEMYGWDSYFIVLGLLESGKVDLARSMVDNFVYEINHYGKILNANRTYYLTRSQPPFFTSMAIAVYRKMKKDKESLMWLEKVLEAAIREYYGYWMGSTHLTRIGLNRYYDDGIGPPPEVEPGRYDGIFSKYAEEYGMDVKTFKMEYLSRRVKVPALDKFFRDDRSMRESGHDASYRLQYDCADLVTVDLNSLLYKVETDIGSIIKDEFGGSVRLRNGSVERAVDWFKKAKRRKILINKYLWNEKAGMYFDFNFVKGKQSNFVSATTFYPL